MYVLYLSSIYAANVYTSYVVLMSLFVPKDVAKNIKINL